MMMSQKDYIGYPQRHTIGQSGTKYHTTTSKKHHQLHGQHWDVLSEIRWTLTQDGLRGCTFSHIQAHQDRKKPYTTLPLRAQLNVDADKLASMYQEAHGQAHPIVLMLPHAAVSLQFQHGTCTSHIPIALRHAKSYRLLANGQLNSLTRLIGKHYNMQSNKKATNGSI
jgi:hypothetical protein